LIIKKNICNRKIYNLNRNNIQNLDMFTDNLSSGAIKNIKSTKFDSNKLKTTEELKCINNEL